MSDFKPLYRYSFYESAERNQQEQWRESFEENKRCRDFIDKMISENFDGLYIKGEIPQRTVSAFGFDRTRWVLANHIQHYDYDGRISPQNKVWASEIYIPRPKPENQRDHTTSYLLKSHQTLVDYVATQIQQMYADLNLYNQRHCVQDDVGDYKSKLLILRADVLKESCRTPENQLFFAESGFGCDPASSGRAVYGQFLIDGEKARFNRQDFIGVCDENYLSDLAKNELETLAKSQMQDETQEPTMEGM